LLGNSRDSQSILSQYKSMIRILPKEFDLKKIKQLSSHLLKLQQPDTIYEEQARINPKFKKSLMHIENVVNVDQPEQTSYWQSKIALPPMLMVEHLKPTAVESTDNLLSTFKKEPSILAIKA
jgi:hypothetical protein